MEDKWFILLRDTLGIAGNFAELVALAFLLTQFRRRKDTAARPKQHRLYEQTSER